MNLVEQPIQLPGQTGFYQGKVRDVYYIGDRHIVMVASNRISAFDVVLPKPIPYKGQVLNQIAAHFLRLTSSLVPNWLLETPAPMVSVGFKAEPVPVEMVVRGYLSGHAWRQYHAGHRELCGVALPDGLRASDPFPEPIITPTTKAKEGHDQDISRIEIMEGGVVCADVYRQMESYSLSLFAAGSRMAANRGLILVDTKYEFGLVDGRVILMDEVHTPDSSRFFIAEGYLERQESGTPQEQLSKEFLRQWLIANGFQGRPGEAVPEMSDAWVEEIGHRYRSLYERITGRDFVRAPNSDFVEENFTQTMKCLNGMGYV
ncbi:MAG: phosphoribosylaminoimidazolesuccinocarboxamide synthase [Sphingomonadales bacterium]|nr:phosphoribosylaminoimidazolesuccinocarboxamide synthase [Sphingomonadales bacterium]